MLTQWRDSLTRKYTDPATNVEGVDLAASVAQVRATGSLGNRPLVVINAGRSAQWTPDFPMDVATRLEQVRQDLRREVVGLSTRSRHIIGVASGHYVQSDEPDLVIAAVRDVVATVRRESRAGAQ